MEVRSYQETEPDERATGFHQSVYCFLSCFKPRKRDNAKKPDILIVDFNGWEYEGTDNLWAGIITNLSKQIENRFGKWKVRLCRALLTSFGDDEVATPHSWNLCYVRWPKYMVMLSLLAIFALSVSLAIALDSIVFTVISALFAVASFIAGIGATCFRLVKSTEEFINIMSKNVKNKHFSEELGFMHRVKREVSELTKITHIMSRLYGKQFRILLIIDDIDRCDDETIMEILKAVYMLLLEPNSSKQDAWLKELPSPYIAILAIDPRLVLGAIERHFDPNKHKDLTHSYVNGYEYLKKIIHVPFYMPVPRNNEKTHFIQSLMQGKKPKPSTRMSHLDRDDQDVTEDRARHQETDQAAESTEEKRASTATAETEANQGTASTATTSAETEANEMEMTPIKSRPGTSRSKESQEKPESAPLLLRVPVQVSTATTTAETEASDIQKQDTDQTVTTATNKKTPASKVKPDTPRTIPIRGESTKQQVNLMEYVNEKLQKPGLVELLTGNPRSLKRICNIVKLALSCFPPEKEMQKPDVFKLLLVVIMVEQWPFRTSFLVECFRYNAQQKLQELLDSDSEQETLDDIALNDESQCMDTDILTIEYGDEVSTTKRLSGFWKDHKSDITEVVIWEKHIAYDWNSELFGVFLKKFPLTLGHLMENIRFAVNHDTNLETVVEQGLIWLKKTRLNNIPNHNSLVAIENTMGETGA